MYKELMKDSHTKKIRENEVDEPRAFYTEWSKSEKEKQKSYINTYRQQDQPSQSQRKLIPNIHWKDSSKSSKILATWCKELTHWKRPWCRERLRTGEGSNRQFEQTAGDRTGKPGILQSTGLQSRTRLSD